MLVTSLKAAGRVVKVQTPQEVKEFTAHLAKDAIADLQRAAKSVRKGETTAEFAAGRVFEDVMAGFLEGISAPAPVAAKSAPAAPVQHGAPVATVAAKSAPLVAAPRAHPLADLLARTLGVRGIKTQSEKLSQFEREEAARQKEAKKRNDRLSRNLKG